MTDPKRWRSSLFCGKKPYTVVNITDIVEAAERKKLEISLEKLESVEAEEKPKSGQIEVWGLTGWYLSLLMKTLVRQITTLWIHGLEIDSYSVIVMQ